MGIHGHPRTSMGIRAYPFGSMRIHGCLCWYCLPDVINEPVCRETVKKKSLFLGNKEVSSCKKGGRSHYTESSKTLTIIWDCLAYSLRRALAKAAAATLAQAALSMETLAPAAVAAGALAPTPAVAAPAMAEARAAPAGAPAPW